MELAVLLPLTSRGTSHPSITCPERLRALAGVLPTRCGIYIAVDEDDPFYGTQGRFACASFWQQLFSPPRQGESAARQSILTLDRGRNKQKQDERKWYSNEVFYLDLGERVIVVQVFDPIRPAPICDMARSLCELAMELHLQHQYFILLGDDVDVKWEGLHWFEAVKAAFARLPGPYGFGCVALHDTSFPGKRISRRCSDIYSAHSAWQC